MSAVTIAEVSTDLEPVVDQVVEATIDLTETEARALTAQLRGVTAELVDLLKQAYRGRAWIPLGYPTFAAYVEDVVGSGLRGLPAGERREITGVFADAQMSQRAIGTLTGRSPERVRADLKLVRPDGVGPTVGVDGREYKTDRATPAPAVKPKARKTVTVLDLLEEVGPDGLTIPELMRRKRWSYGVASATLSRLNAQADPTGPRGQRRVERVAAWRCGYAVYVAPTCVAGREVLAPGQRRGRQDGRP